VANIKLPMRDKNPILFRVRRILEEGGWRWLTLRQLYHDRDEATATARRVG
jgi:23S rRNA (cytidine2498-2'-O)-methyltransferase